MVPPRLRAVRGGGLKSAQQENATGIQLPATCRRSQQRGVWPAAARQCSHACRRVLSLLPSEALLCTDQRGCSCRSHGLQSVCQPVCLGECKGTLTVGRRAGSGAGPWRGARGDARGTDGDVSAVPELLRPLRRAAQAAAPEGRRRTALGHVLLTANGEVAWLRARLGGPPHPLQGSRGG